MSPAVALGLGIVLMAVCTTVNRFTEGFQAIGPSVAMLVAFWFAWRCLESAATVWPWGLCFAVWAGASGALAVAVGSALGESVTGLQVGLSAVMGLAALGLLGTLPTQ